MAVTCRCCRLPAPLRDRVAAEHRRGVPLRTIAEGLAAAGEPVHRDAIWRHCRDHVAPAGLHDVEHTDTETSAGITVAAAVAGVLGGWPGLAARAAAKVRAEGLTVAADVLMSETPESMRDALHAAVGSPGSEVLEARLLASAWRNVLAHDHPEVTRALATFVRARGGDDLAEALEDLAESVETGSTPEEHNHGVKVRALRRALTYEDPESRRRALITFERMYEEPTPELRAEAEGLIHPRTAPVGGVGLGGGSHPRGAPTTTKEHA